MNQNVQVFLTVLASVMASSGFWALLQKVFDKKDYSKAMLLGLAHDRIVHIGMTYLERGDWITQDEYESLNLYLYTPYTKMGGNGTAAKIMDAVNKLRIVKNSDRRSMIDVL